MNTRRTAIWLGSLFGGLLYLFILASSATLFIPQG